MDWDRFTFRVVRGLLALVATLSGLVALSRPFSAPTATPGPAVDIAGSTAIVTFAVALVGLAICYRPDRAG